MKKDDFFTSTSNRIWLMGFVEILFDKMTNLPVEIRPDDKPRTEMIVVVHELGTKNILHESISKTPSNQCWSKPVRLSSLKSLLSEKSKINITNDGLEPAGYLSVLNLRIWVSGLKEDENVFIALAVLAKILQENIKSVLCSLEANGEKLPNWSKNQNSYHWRIL